MFCKCWFMFFCNRQNNLLNFFKKIANLCFIITLSIYEKSIQTEKKAYFQNIKLFSASHFNKRGYMLSEIAKKYHAERNGNCAQSVAYALAQAKGFPKEKLEELLSNMSRCGGGKAPAGLCGALYAALQFVSEENKSELINAFKENSQGEILCKEIRSKKILPCNACVELAAKSLERFG